MATRHHTETQNNLCKVFYSIYIVLPLYSRDLESVCNAIYRNEKMCKRHLLDKIRAALLFRRVNQSSNSALLTALFLRSLILTPTTSCVVVVYTWICYCGLLESKLRIQDLSGPSPLVKISPASILQLCHNTYIGRDERLLKYF